MCKISSEWIARGRNHNERISGCLWHCHGKNSLGYIGFMEVVAGVYDNFKISALRSPYIEVVACWGDMIN